MLVHMSHVCILCKWLPFGELYCIHYIEYSSAVALFQARHVQKQM